ncbi:choice-of-anchor X domain-containing protein, partial [Arthrospira platensis SPKY1]|nr:choice-of-anchor X domain-containing protein [Arthrospira platensis SPKY1]
MPFYHTPIGIKPFIQQRRASALSQLDLNDIAPILTQVQNNLPNALQDVSVTVRAMDDGVLGSVELCYRIDGQSFTCIPMYDDGEHADGGPGDGLYGSV